MKVKKAILQEIEDYINGRIDELSKLAKEFAEIDNYVEIAKMKELQNVQKMMTVQIFQACPLAGAICF